MTREEAARILDPDTTASALKEYGDGNAQIAACDEACRIAADVLRNKPTGEPLTLEQLREMVDKPAYLYIYDTALNSEWHIIKAVTEDKIIFRGLGTVYVPISSLGKCFDLYAYPPAHIDMEAWKPCDYCANTMQNREVYKTEKYAGLCDFEVFLDCGEEIAVNAYNHQTPYTDEICFSFPVSYCPKCGRPLTEEARVKLEKRLRG